MTEFGKITLVGRSIFLGGQPRLHPKGRGPSVPKFWDPCLHLNGLTFKNLRGASFICNSVYTGHSLHHAEEFNKQYTVLLGRRNSWCPCIWNPKKFYLWSQTYRNWQFWHTRLQNVWQRVTAYTIYTSFASTALKWLAVRLVDPRLFKVSKICTLAGQATRWPIHVKFGIAEENVGPLGRTKFHANRCTVVGTRPKKLKISTFW